MIRSTLHRPEPELGHQPLLNDPENAYLQDFYIAQQRGDSALTDHYADTMGQFTEPRPRLAR